MFNLREIGWNHHFSQSLEEYKIERRKQKPYYQNKTFTVARVSAQHKNSYSIITEEGEQPGILRRVFLHEVSERADLPAVGDWVVLIDTDNSDERMIDGVLPRMNKLSRISAGTPGAFNPENAGNQYSKLDKGEQILCANVDIAFIVTSLNQDFNLRRLERYLTMVWDDGINPVILLTKADLCEEEAIDEKLEAISAIGYGIPTHIISALDGTGMDELDEYWESNRTMVLIGSSGVGKSTLINRVLGYDRMRVKEITNYKDKGQHTTTHKELMLLKKGGIIIDTPGMRELQLTGGEDSLDLVFGDILKEIETLSQNCKFRDCRHRTEPGCAVKEALENGELSEERWQAYQKLLKEIRYQEKKAEAKEIKKRKKAKRT